MTVRILDIKVPAKHKNSLFIRTGDNSIAATKKQYNKLVAGKSVTVRRGGIKFKIALDLCPPSS